LYAMNQEEFVEAIKITVLENSIEAVKSNLVNPPGKEPSKELVILSEWYNKLGDQNRSFVDKVISMTSDMATFGFLCVLDGVRAIEDSPDKGRLILTFTKDNKEVLLNDEDGEFLHDLL
jgi:hypothetical protein